MKRTRALESRQYRRTVKKSKFTESVYFNTSTFGYLKLFSIWISCITFDLLVGCRLELGWPILLFVRRYSEIVGAPNGTLRFHSTFSIFYLFLTITSDLVCYLFLPVQQLLFLASTYVWLQFTYQTVDRGLSPAVIGFCVLFVCFEYFLRYQITSPQWYESRSLLLTASLLPTVTDAFLANQMSTTRLALYRIFASHSLGFPLVTFGFRFKNIISDWLYEKRREDVQKKNEIFDKILTEAIPMVYEGKKRHEFNTRQHLALEGEVLDFELDPTGNEFLEEPKYSLPSNGPVPSIFDKLGNGPVSSVPVRPAIDTMPYSRKTSKAKLKPNGLPKGVKHKASTSSMTLRSNGQSSIVDEEPNNNQINEDDEINSKESSKTLYSASSWLINFIQSFIVNWLLSALVIVRSTGNSVVEHAISVSNGVRSDAAAVFNGIEPDDSMSTSGDGSQNAEDEESDRESVLTNTMDTIDKNGTIRTAQNSNGWSNSNGQTKKKGKKNRGRTPTNVTDLPEGEFELQYPIDEMINGKGRKNKIQPEEKKEDELERLKLDLRGAKLVESELREQIAGLHQYEKSAKNEVQQYKIRFEQLDTKYKILLKQQEQTKTTINNLEKKIGETQNRKDQLEKELIIERSAATKNNMSDTKTNDSMIETMKSKIVKLENDLKKIRSEYRTKEDLSIKLETKLKEMQNQKSVAQKSADDGSMTVTRLELENAQLKKALSEENRVKQDLFLALKTSKAKIDNLQTKLRSFGIMEETEHSNVSSNSNGAVCNDLLRFSPNTSSSPPPPFGSRIPDLDSSFMGGLYSYSSGLSGMRSSPSDYLRDSPTTNMGQMLGTPIIGTPQHHNATTTHSN